MKGQLKYKDMMALKPGTKILRGGRIFDLSIYGICQVTNQRWKTALIFLGITRNSRNLCWMFKTRNPQTNHETTHYFSDSGIVPYSSGNWNKYNYCVLKARPRPVGLRPGEQK